MSSIKENKKCLICDKVTVSNFRIDAFNYVCSEECFNKATNEEEPLRRSVKEWLSDDVVNNTLLKWTENWYKEDESCEEFAITENDHKITKKYLLSQLEYLRDDEGWENTEEEEENIDYIIVKYLKGGKDEA